MELLVVLEPEFGAEAEEAERLGRQLRRELDSLDVDSVRSVVSGEPPPGSKGVDPASLTELMVTLSASGGALAVVLGTIKEWLGRRAAGHKVSLTIDGDTLEVDGATTEEQAHLIDTFVRRHRSV